MAAFYEEVLSGTYDNHVLPFLWMKGEPRETITEYLEKIAGADIHEVCLESRTHPDFCGDGWWDDLRFIIDECKRLGMKIWLLDDAHFPTGYANGALECEDVDPRLRKTVLKHRTVDVVGPTPSVSIKLGNLMDPTERFLGAVALQDGAPIKLSITVERNEGAAPVRLRFDAPAGTTQIELLVTSQKTGYRDEYINMVDAVSCRALIDAVYEPTFQQLGDEFGKTILGFFTDEPGFMNEKGAVQPDASADSYIGRVNMALPWSDALAERLQAALGEHWLSELPGLWNRSPRGARVRHTYMDIATQLYRACFDEQVGDWCRAHGVMHIGHVIEDKGYHTRLGQGAGHYFRAVAGQDMAGVDVVINQLVPGVDSGQHAYFSNAWDMEFFNYALAKLGSSAARLDPKKQGRCMAEVFGAFGWHEGLREMKWIADHMLVRGVNWFTPHAFSMAPFPDFDCPPHFYAHGNNPQFRNFGKLMSYMNRTASLLSGGAASTPVAVLYHADAEWAGEAMPVERVAAELTRAQVNFDFVPAEAFEDASRYEVEIAEGELRVNGCAYRALVLPEAAFIGHAVAEAAAQAAQAGVRVHAVNRIPLAYYDGERADDAVCVSGGEAAAIDSEATETAEVVGLLNPDMPGGVAVTPLENLAGALVEAGLATVRTDMPQPWLRALAYEREGETYLMLVNEHPKQGISTALTLGDGSAVEGVRIDMLNGTAPVAFGGTLELAPYESCIVVLNADASGAGSPKATPASVVVAQGTTNGGAAIEVNGPWAVAFAAPLEYPAFGEVAALKDLHDLTAVEFAGKCGTFRYHVRFESQHALEHAILDLGEVYETAEVTLDGTPLGARIAPPYRFEAGALAAGTHELVVDVTNTLDHALGADIFTLTEPEEPSGLMGPVRVHA